MRLKVFQKITRHRLSGYIILLLACLIAFWPLSFGVFSVKNDAIQYFLPFRYNISEAVQNGSLPFWSPSIYLGYPIHGDMQSGAWNPFVLVTSIFTRYNVSVLHTEYLLYIFIAGAGMYQLCRLMTENRMGRLLIALAYISCGYIFSSAQFINWMASAAFVPWLAFTYFRFLQAPGTVRALSTAICAWLLLVCGYPADFIFCIYLLFILTVWLAIRNRSLVVTRESKIQYAAGFGWMALSFLLLSLPAIVSFAELLPYYERGGTITHGRTVVNSFEWKHLISLLNPWPTWAEDYQSSTDPTGRDMFIGIIPLALFFLSLFTPFNPAKKALVLILVVVFLFSLGDATPLHRLFYHILPGFSSFRHPSHFRLYLIMAMLLLSAGEWKQVSIQQAKKFRMALSATAVLCVICLILFMPFDFQRLFANFSLENGNSVKSWLMNLRTNDLAAAGMVVQLIFLLSAILLYSNAYRYRTVLILASIINLFIFQSLMPVHLVGKTKPETINRAIYSFNQNYEVPLHQSSLFENSSHAFDHFDETGLAYFYSQRPGISHITNSPSFLRQQADFLSNDFLYQYLGEKPVVWISRGSLPLKDSLGVTNICPISFVDEQPVLFSCQARNRIDSLRSEGGYFAVSLYAEDSCFLNLSQNYHHRWKVFVNDTEQTVMRANIAFMAVKLPAGRHRVEFKYSAPLITILFWISVCTLLICVFTIVKKQRRPI